MWGRQERKRSGEGDESEGDGSESISTISAYMKVSEQCGIAASKGNQIIGLIRRNITYKEKLIIPLYKAIVRLHLEVKGRSD